MSLVLHIADKVFRIPKGFRSQDDFVETEHLRNKSGEFTKKGGEGQGGAKKKPNFAPSAKPPVVLNAVAQTFKKHGLTKLKAKSETGHPQFYHPDLGTFQVGHSKEGQTYASKFHHNETGTEGVGQHFLHNYLTELKADKENSKFGTIHFIKHVSEPAKEPEPTETKKSAEQITFFPKHFSITAAAGKSETVNATGVGLGENAVRWEYIDPVNQLNTSVMFGTGENAGKWRIWQAGKGEIAKGEGQKSFNAEFEKLHPRGEGGKFVAKPETVSETAHKQLLDMGFEPKAATPWKQDVQIYAKPDGQILLAKGGDVFTITPKFFDPQTHAEIDELSNLSKLIGAPAKPAEIPPGYKEQTTTSGLNGIVPIDQPAAQQIVSSQGQGQVHQKHKSTLWNSILSQYEFTQEKDFGTHVKYTGPNGQVLFLNKTHPPGHNYAWTYKKDMYSPEISGEGGVAFQSKIGAPTISEPPAAKKSVSPDILNLSDLKQIGPQLGSNPGGTYEDAEGNKYYVKHPKSKDHARNELLAAALYGAVGGNTLNYHQVMNGDQLSVATKLQTLKATALDQLTPEQKKEAKKDFAIQAWLANWDAVGLSGDNVGIDEAGKTISLDFGGALLYRAKGAPKGPYFDSNANEWESMRNPAKNPQAASLYGDMTADELKQSAARLQKISNDQIYQLASQFAPEGQAASLADKLIARKTAILNKANSVGHVPTPQPPTPQLQPVEQPKPKVPVEDLKLQLDSAFNTYLNEGYNGNVAQAYTKAYHALQTHAPPLSNDEAFALGSYKGSGYQSMNQSARQGSHSNDPKVKQLTNYLNRCEIPMDLQVVRRVKGEFANHIQSIVDIGTRWKERGFTSASLDPQALEGWGPVTMIIDVPKGTKGATVKNPGESEILFQRDITYLECYHIDHATKTYFCRMSQHGTI